MNVSNAEGVGVGGGSGPGMAIGKPASVGCASAASADDAAPQPIIPAGSYPTCQADGSRLRKTEPMLNQFAVRLPQ